MVDGRLAIEWRSPGPADAAARRTGNGSGLGPAGSVASKVLIDGVRNDDGGATTEVDRCRVGRCSGSGGA